MKKLIVIAIIAMMITGLSVAANAVQGDFWLNLRPVLAGGQAAATVVMGSFSDAVNGDPDGYYNMQFNPSNNGVLEMDITGPVVSGDRWYVDMREPLTGPLDTMTWNLRAKMSSSTTGTAAYSFSLAGGFLEAAGTIEPGFYMKVYASDIGGTQGALLMTFDSTTGYALDNMGVVEGPGTLTSGPFSLASRTAVQYFTVVAGTAPTVPEPGSMLAMFSGLVGLVGFGIRRRK